jgi:predicted PurR-regulated permease PerM
VNESKPAAAVPRPDRHVFFWLATASLVVAIFSRAQEILVPLALSVVIAFALSPIVKRLERRLGRVVAIALVAVVAFAAVTAFGYLLKHQLVDLSTQMTKYSESMRRKVSALRGPKGGGLAGLSKSIDRVVQQLDERVADDREARPVKLIPAEATTTERIEAVLTPVLAPLAKVLIVLVLVIFLLGKHEDLRDRFIRLVGRGKLTLTTRTLDEAGLRISRFILHQSVINGGFGVVVALGLLAIGIPYAPLWGFVAAMLRFVPFVGTTLAMLFPAALAFVQFEGWGPMLATLALFVGLDIVTAYVIEPLVIGAKTGVSSMAMVVSAIFWTWLWGPVGLVLSTPMTVCLVVLGKHITRLEFLAVLLSDEPALEPEFILYQRLLAGDEDEAHEILEKQFRTTARGEVFDRVIIPALLLANRDRARDEIAEADHDHVLRTIRSIVDDSPEGAGTRDLSSHRSATTPPLRVLGVSARSATDELIWEMLAQLFDPTRVAVESVGSAYLASEVIVAAETQLPDLVCIISIPPGGLAQARYICKRIRAKLPDTQILVIRPGIQANGQESAQKLTEDGASGVVFTLQEAHSKAEQLLSTSQTNPLRSSPA